MLTVFPLIYFAVIIGAGVSARRRVADTADFYLARRSAGVWLVTGSLVATIFGAFATMGVSGMAYRDGLVAGWYLWGGALGLIALGAWGLRRLDIRDVYTLPELLGRGYGLAVRRVAATLIAVSWISLIAAQLIALGKIVRFMVAQAGWGNPTFIVIVSAGVVALTCYGGQRAVLRTDCVQALFIVVGLAALLVGAFVAKPDALSGLEGGALRLPFNSAMPPAKWLAVMMTFGVPFLVGPDIYSRLFSGRGREAARVSVLLTAALMVPLAFMIVLAGVLARAILGGGLSDDNVAILDLSRLALPPVWGGLLVAGLLAAVMSTANTCLLTVSTLVSRDLLDTWRSRPLEGKAAVNQGRWIVLAAGAASLLVALYKQDIVAALMNCYKVYSPAVLCPFLAMLIFPGRRFSAIAGSTAVLAGGACALAGILLKSEALQLLAFAASAIPLAAIGIARIASRAASRSHMS